MKEFWNFQSPEEYSGLNLFEDNACVGQDNKLTYGRMPFYYINEFNKKMKLILGGAKLKLPDGVLSPPGEGAEVDDAEERRRILCRREE